MARGRKVTLSFKVKGSIDIDDLVRKLSEKAPAGSISIRLKGNRLEINLDSPLRSSAMIKKVVTDALPHEKAYATTLTRDDAQRLGAPGLSLDIVEYILRKRGYEAHLSGGTLMTSAAPAVVRSLLSEVSAVLSSVRDLSVSAKKAVAAASVLSGVSPDVAVEVGIRKGVLQRKGDESNKIFCITEWREAADLIRGSLKGEHEDKQS